MCIVPTLSRYSPAPKEYVCVCFRAIFITIPDYGIVVYATGMVHNPQGFSLRRVHSCRD